MPSVSRNKGPGLEFEQLQHLGVREENEIARRLKEIREEEDTKREQDV